MQVILQRNYETYKTESEIFVQKKGDFKGLQKIFKITDRRHSRFSFQHNMDFDQTMSDIEGL
ncbi:hypothetical protein V5J35_000768 [Endozoicomonas sp. NE40]|uniref:Uncharacterized protein n=1 Tax=Endozoicomonas lisbonensis TaxID=3120522 RepID=A0ABV2SCS9_9GAMM